MSILYSIQTSFIHLYQKVSQKKIAKIFTISAITVYWTAFISSFLIIRLIANVNFTPLSHLISDLGSAVYSPFPLLFDIGCIFAGLFSFPITLYIYRYLKKKSQQHPEENESIKIINLITLIAGILGDIGFVGIGFFSIDRNFFEIHFIFAAFLFIGYYLSAFLIGALYIFFKLDLNKYVAAYGFFLTIAISFSAFMLYLLQIGSILFEWIADFALLFWLYTFLYTIFRKRK
jgi:preprotein translocase subunit YajC